MASLVVKVPWVAPACAPAAGVAPVTRSCAKDCVAFITAPFLILLFSNMCIPLFSCHGMSLPTGGATSCPLGGSGLHRPVPCSRLFLGRGEIERCESRCSRHSPAHAPRPPCFYCKQEAPLKCHQQRDE